MSDRKLLTYVGYPSDLYPQPPSWANRLFEASSQGEPFRFFVSGGRITDTTRDELARRDTLRVENLAQALQGSYPSRIVPAIATENLESISSLAAGTASSELRVLADLWVMARADVCLFDCDSLGRARCGLEISYANLLGVETLGVTDLPSLDPWLHYHVGRIVRPHDILHHLRQILGSTEALEAREDAREAPEGLAHVEPHEVVGFGD